MKKILKRPQNSERLPSSKNYIRIDGDNQILQMATKPNFGVLLDFALSFLTEVVIKNCFRTFFCLDFDIYVSQTHFIDSKISNNAFVLTFDL